PGGTTAGAGEGAAFLLANPAGLLAFDEEARLLGRIVDLAPQSAPSTPALHPSRESIAFAYIRQPDPRTGFGSDIFTVKLDGTGLRPLVEHEAENVFYASPRFDPSGNLLYFHRRAAVVQGGQYVGNEDTIERLDLRTGERRRVVSDAADPDISPDGRALVYVRVVNGQIEGLWTASSDGTGARPFFRTRDTFWYLQAPRFSPSGREVVFSAAGHSQSGLPQGPASRARSGAKRAHLGIPSDLFLAPADGSSVRSIGQTGDDVVPAWSPDGGRIAYIGTGAFFALTVADGTVRVLAQGEDFFFGDLIWLR
ncbi:MAG: TolB family protein, partial [Candidatus Limnocylindria bacterium]